MSLTVSLETIASIKLGWSVKKAIEDVGDQGNYYLVQTGNIDGEPISESELTQISDSEKAQYQLEPGDILLRLRGSVFSVSILMSRPSKPMIATNQIAIIRANPRVNTYYLHWFLNSQAGQQYFRSRTEGTSIAKLNRKSVGETPIPLPASKTQEHIGEIWKTWLEQRAIYKDLIDNGNDLYTSICQKLLVTKRPE